MKNLRDQQDDHKWMGSAVLIVAALLILPFLAVTVINLYYRVVDMIEQMSIL